MIENPTLLLLSTLTLSLLVPGCQPAEPGASSTGDEAGTARAPAPEEPADRVAFEPAYPTDVSAEGLSDEDVAQQQTGHEHDGEEHSHGDDEGHDDHHH